jgi:hypothetical protein
MHIKKTQTTSDQNKKLRSSKLQSNRLAIECAKLEPEFEKGMAEDGLNEIIA